MNFINNSEVITSGDLVVFGGIVAKSPDNILLFPFDVAKQTLWIIDHIKLILENIGLGLDHLIMVTVYLPDQKHYCEMNKAYTMLMPSPLPPRKVIFTPLTVEGAVVEFTAMASIHGKHIVRYKELNG
ncbi:putative aminoacrylate peracid reductase RutC [bioreactor metagenome]|uniref:Putative aminoacrylate peracid reductase RutC n=1 Tax=bioreactor metagenome TaxID=1076179 RepID=A0A645H1D2_9ZZZZ